MKNHTNTWMGRTTSRPDCIQLFDQQQTRQSIPADPAAQSAPSQLLGPQPEMPVPGPSPAGNTSQQAPHLHIIMSHEPGGRRKDARSNIDQYMCLSSSSFPINAVGRATHRPMTPLCPTTRAQAPTTNHLFRSNQRPPRFLCLCKSSSRSRVRSSSSSLCLLQLGPQLLFSCLEGALQDRKLARALGSFGGQLPVRCGS